MTFASIQIGANQKNTVIELFRLKKLDGEVIYLNYIKQ